MRALVSKGKDESLQNERVREGAVFVQIWGEGAGVFCLLQQATRLMSIGERLGGVFFVS